MSRNYGNCLVTNPAGATRRVAPAPDRPTCLGGSGPGLPCEAWVEQGARLLNYIRPSLMGLVGGSSGYMAVLAVPPGRRE